MIEPQADEERPSPPSSGSLDDALALVEFLRAHCAWDAAQTHLSLRRYLLEEAHEVVDAIDAGDDPHLRDELGDLLLNLAFQMVIAEERGAFDRTEVLRGLQEKMKRRHPHIFGKGEAVSWESLKAAERGHEPGDSGLLRDIIAGADPLAHARKIQEIVASVGFDWPNATGAWEKVREEVDEVGTELSGGRDDPRLEEEIGDLLFAVVNLARLCGVHPSTALMRANTKFVRRFGRVESKAAALGIEIDEAGLDVLDRLWNDVKREEA